MFGAGPASSVTEGSVRVVLMILIDSNSTQIPIDINLDVLGITAASTFTCIHNHNMYIIHNHIAHIQPLI